MRKLIIIPALALLLMAATCTPQNTMQRVTIACEGYASTLNSLTAFRNAGKLSAEQVATVDQWEPILTGACLGDPADVNAGLLDQIEDGLFELIEVRRTVQ